MFTARGQAADTGRSDSDESQGRHRFARKICQEQGDDGDNELMKGTGDPHTPYEGGINTNVKPVPITPESHPHRGTQCHSERVAP